MSILDESLTHHLGMDHFVWFIGVVEDVASDVLNVGRCKVRIFGWHEADAAKLPTADLPWAFPILSVTHATNVPSYVHGSWVVGFFLDGKLGQQPMVFGVLPAIPQQ